MRIRSRSAPAACLAMAAACICYFLLAAILLRYFFVIPVRRDASILFEWMAVVQSIGWLHWPLLTMVQLGAAFVLLFAARESYRQRQFDRQWKARVQERRVPYDASRLPPPDLLGGQEVTVIRSDRLEAFAIGFADPRIVVSTRLLRVFDRREVEAVLWHEAYHCMQRDPMKHYGLAIIERSLGFIPLIGGLVRYATIWGELEADRHAFDRMGGSAALGSVLVKWTRTAAARESALQVVRFDAGPSINYRLRQAIAPGSAIRIPVLTWRGAAGTAAAALLLFGCIVDFY